MKNLLIASFIALVVISLTDCTKSPDKALIGRWELVGQGCDDKGDNCKESDSTVLQTFKENGQCIRHVASFNPSLYTYKVKDKHVKLSLYENDSVIKEFDIIDYDSSEMLIKWQYYTNCDKYKKL